MYRWIDSDDVEFASTGALLYTEYSIEHKAYALE